MSSFSNSQDQENLEPTVTLTDANGRSLPCYVEHSLEVEGAEYMLLLPVDYPIEIVVWDDDDDEEATFVEEEEVISKIFADAQAVLEEQNLKLKRTAYTLTVEGDLPPVEEQDILSVEDEEENSEIEPEEFQFLVSFYHEEQEYEIYTPLDPLLFFARKNQNGQPELLSPEEFKKIQPLLEEQMFDEME
ncbi:MAG: DUF3727 domain-containing protein [Cyanosarcina radialis HA8281-LM2]|jgi:hypothetical protein|nr:DUF3727 domain-containing protein [Cyanosarcina radialis HA8281-LM2]